MSRIQITIDTDNAAFFQDGISDTFEVSRILNNMAERMQDFDSVSDFSTINERIRDINGNNVGIVKYWDRNDYS